MAELFVVKQKMTFLAGYAPFVETRLLSQKHSGFVLVPI